MESRRLIARIAPPLVAVMAMGCGHFQARKDQALIDAVRANSLEKVQVALRAGANPNVSINDGATDPLFVAISNHDSHSASRRAIIDVLLGAGADPSRPQRDGMDGLYVAVSFGDAGLCSQFCKSGLSPMRISNNGVSAFHLAAAQGKANCLASMIPFLRAGEINALTTAKGHTETALTLACGNGRQEAAELLLEHGADPNILGDSSWNALIAASYSGHLDLVNLLLNHGAKVDLPFENGGTALSLMCLNGKLEIARSLITHGADINHQNKSGITPLMDAAENGHDDVVELLLKSGARKDLRDKKGRTVSDYAKLRRSKPPGAAPESVNG